MNMLKHFPVFMFFVPLFVLITGCSSGTMGERGDTVPEISKSLRYMDYLYSKDSAESLKNQYFTGPICERHPQEMRRMLNLLLRFPVQGLNSAAASYSGSNCYNTADTDWTDSMPRELLNWCTANRIDTSSDNIGEKLIRFFDSNDGRAFISSSLGEIQAGLNNINNYSIADFPNEYNESIKQLMSEGGFLALSESVSESGADNSAINKQIYMTINPFSGIPGMTSLYQGYIHHKGIKGELARINDLLEQTSLEFEKTQVSLKRIEAQIDNHIGYTVDCDLQPLYQDAKRARTMLTILERQLVCMKNLDDPETIRKLKWFISTENFESTGFQMMMENAFKSMCDTQKWILDNNLIQDTNLELMEREVDVFQNIWSPVLLKSPLYFVKSSNITLRSTDVLLLIKLSKARLQLAEYIYKGDELLRFRKSLAEYDLKNYFVRINNAIDCSFNNTNNAIKSYINSEFTPEPCPSAQELVMSRFTEFHNLKEKNDCHAGIAFIAYSCYYCIDIYADSLNSSIYYSTKPLDGAGFGVPGDLDTLKCPPVGLYSLIASLGGDDSSLELFRDVIFNRIMANYYPRQKEYNMQFKAMVIAWMMTLQAHINAAEDL